MTVSQADDGRWFYEYSELPGLVPMKYGMKSFDIIEQITCRRRDHIRTSFDRLWKSCA